jgi:hypothetical protein
VFSPDVHVKQKAPVSVERNRALLEGELGGMRLPATRDGILAWLLEHGADTAQAERLPEREYLSANDVGEELWPVEPAPLVQPPQPGRTQSGDRPGGAEYAAKADK